MSGGCAAHAAHAALRSATPRRAPRSAGRQGALWRSSLPPRSLACRFPLTCCSLCTRTPLLADHSADRRVTPHPAPPPAPPAQSRVRALTEMEMQAPLAELRELLGEAAGLPASMPEVAHLEVRRSCCCWWGGRQGAAPGGRPVSSNLNTSSNRWSAWRRVGCCRVGVAQGGGGWVGGCASCRQGCVGCAARGQGCVGCALCGQGCVGDTPGPPPGLRGWQAARFGHCSLPLPSGVLPLTARRPLCS